MSDNNKARYKRGKFSEALVAHPYLVAGSLIVTVIGGVAGLVFGVWDRVAPQEESRSPADAVSVHTLVADEPAPVANDPTELSVDFRPHKPEVTAFVLPGDVSFEDFPFGLSPGCTDDQLQWLRQHGTERRTNWFVEFRSTAAGDGNMIALENLRLTGEVTESAEPGSIFVDCPDAGTPDLAYVRAEIVGASDPLRADVEMTTIEDPTPRPFMYNLAPGEVGIALLSLVGGEGFSGEVTVEVASGDDSEALALNESPLQLPAVAGIELELIVHEGNAGLFSCRHMYDEQGPSWPCTPDDVRSYLADPCTDQRLRGALQGDSRPLFQPGDVGGQYFYDAWAVHSCGDGFALVEASHSAGSSFDFWALRLDGDAWSVALVGSTGLGTPAEQAIFDRDELDAALDGEVDAFLAAVGETTQPGRAVAD